MTIEWTNDLSTGIDWQDDQHKELFKRIGDLLNAMIEERGDEEVGETIEFLEEYVVVHFGEEERAMEKYGYPDAETHAAEHGSFRNTVSTFRLTGEPEDRSAYVMDKLVGWLQIHIGESDKRLGAFLRDKGVF